MRTIALTLLTMDIEAKENLFCFMPQAQFFLSVALNLRDTWLMIDKIVSDDTQSNLLTRMIEDGNEYLNFIQDVYDVVIEHEGYHKMLTKALMEVCFVPVVLQSLCCMNLKPKM